MARGMWLAHAAIFEYSFGAGVDQPERDRRALEYFQLPFQLRRQPFVIRIQKRDEGALSWPGFPVFRAALPPRLRS